MTKTEALGKTKRLECAVCGEMTIGRQWWNRDHGYGLCTKCAEWLRQRGTSEDEMESCYGKEGIHYNVEMTTEV